jgi:hypothetical protein
VARSENLGGQVASLGDGGCVSAVVCEDLFEHVARLPGVVGNAKLIPVRQAAVVVNYELRLTDVKTTNGRRTIDVNDDVVRALEVWRRKQAEERLLLGAG